MRKLALLSVLVCLFGPAAFAQAPFALAPVARQQFQDASGKPLLGGRVFTYAAGTTNLLATYTDNLGAVPNTNPIILDAGGFATIYLSANSYKFVVQSASGVQQWSQDNVSDVGQILYAKSVLTAPAGRGNQTIAGPLTADFFVGASAHVTSTGVRVALLDPVTTLDAASNPPTLTTVAPAVAGQNYNIPDPGVAISNFVLNPGGGTSNALDCTLTGITCKRTAYVYLEGAACNNATAALGWDTFGTNSPTPLCITGTNTQKGVMAMPSAATHTQKNTNTVAAGGTVTVTYPAATVAGNLLVATVAFDTTRTITGCTDTTNVYTQAKHVANGALSVDVWYFNGASVSMPAASTLTCTFSGAANASIIWHEYNGILTAGALDVTASNTATGTAVTTGTTAGTAQNTELVLAFGGALTNPSMVGSTGFVDHGSVTQGANVVGDDEGKIQQATSTQSGAFTLGSSQIWAAGIVTFKANVGATISAQRSIALPPFFLASANINATAKWQAPLLPLGTVNAVIGAAIGCTADGSTDDSAFSAPITATVVVPASSTNTLVTTPLNTLTSTGCVASSHLHYQVQRLRYNASDTYEGYLYFNGASLAFGVTQ